MCRLNTPFHFHIWGFAVMKKKTRKVCFLFYFVLDFEGVLCLLEGEEECVFFSEAKFSKIIILIPSKLAWV